MARKKKADTQWEQPATPPPPLFTGQKEKDFVKQVNDELIERVIGQQVAYFAVDIDRSLFHPVYGEAIQKTFLPPVRVHALVKWEGQTNLFTEGLGIDKATSIEIHFHKRRLTEDQDLYVREGDFVLYGDRYYEIVSTSEPKQLFGQAESKFEIVGKCVRAREGTFNPQFIAGTVPQRKEYTTTTIPNGGTNGIIRPNGGGGNIVGAGTFTNATINNNLIVSGSTFLGDGVGNDVVQVTGSLNISGSLYLNGYPITSINVSASNLSYNTRTITSSYNITLADNFIGIDTNYDNIVVTLPPLSTVQNGRYFIIKDETGLSNVNPVIISASAGDLVDLEEFTTLDIDFVGVSIYKNSNGWHVF
jgi:hypothetical protein